MATTSAQFHESADDLRPETRDRHRAIVSLVEELDAVGDQLEVTAENPPRPAEAA